MPPPEVEPRQPSSLHSTAMAIAEETEPEPEEPATVEQPMNPSTARYQLFNTNISPISLRASSSQREVSGMQPMEETTVPLPMQSCLRRSMRIANRLRSEISSATPRVMNLPRSRRLASFREHATSVAVKTETVTQLPRVKDAAQKNHSQNVRPAPNEWMANHIRTFLDQLNNGNVRELQKIPGIGSKTAFSLTLYRSRQGGFQNLDQVKSLPIRPGNRWERICEANCLET
ncbi:kinesin-like protein Nod isoform X2 [Drosophila teissieri]|uniref:kinesin-like protein Nod isoform X1 n=1 Tax=Drosophila teissieri TaxID=7243 RepID=UPI001CBA337E|nr:kinesin-like protein Nod isoform X1 [Drosophila teissieri]XP_043657151.1 kinesin-like protein Nod isoform X2 [Drosophila teissieri]